MDNIEERVKAIFVLIFNVDDINMLDHCGYGTFEKWDSLGHMNLITALEEEFNVRFSDDDVTDMLTISLVNDIVSSNLN